MPAKKGNNMAKNKKDFYAKEEINRRAKEHNCNVMCYTSKSMCPRVETCSETCVKEFWATIFSTVIYLLFFNPVAWIIWLIILDHIMSK